MQLGSSASVSRSSGVSSSRASALTNSPPLIPIRRWIFHTDRLIPTPWSASRQAITCWYTLSISVPSRSNRNAGLLRASNSTVGIFAQLPYARDHRRKHRRPSGRPGRRRRRSRGGVPARVDRRGRGDASLVRAPGRGFRAALRARSGGQPVGAPGCGSAMVGDRIPSGQRPGRRPLRRAARRGVRVRDRVRLSAGAAPPVAVLSFADEEGARFNTPTFGSKALSGRLDLPAVLERRDDAGVALGDAMRAAGVDPDGIGDAPGWLRTLAGFIEIHIDQTTDLAGAGEPVGLVSALAARTRLQIVLRGPSRSRRNDAPVRAPRRAGGGGPADRRRRGPGRGGSFADGDDGADPGRAELADDDRGRGTAVDRRALPGGVRGDRRVAGSARRARRRVVRPDRGRDRDWRRLRAATGASSRHRSGPRWPARARRSSAMPSPSSLQRRA